MNNNFQDFDPLEEKLIHSGALHPNDLTFNQIGDLSPWQKHWLMLEAAAWIFQAGIDLALIAFAWLFFYLQHNNLEIFLLGSLFWNFALGISVFICIEHARPILADIKSNEVESISGTISKRYAFGSTGRAGGRGIVYFGLSIRGHIFSVSPSVWASIIEHRTYQLFYMPNTKRIINIEPLLLSHEKKQSALAALQQRALSITRDGK